MRAARLLFLSAVLVGAAASASAQLTDAPKPVPAPPTPGPPKIAPAPKVNLGAPGHPSRLDIDIPGAPSLSPVSLPEAPAITPADKTDPTPPFRSAAEDEPPPRTSPGADESRIEQIAFPIDPGSSQIPNAGQLKLHDMAQQLAQSPEARIEVRTFAPVKGTSESDARRLALARFLAIRDYLLQNGVADDRIDGRALSSTPKEPNADRVEIYIER